MEPELLVERVNSLPYPPTIYSHKWIYGVWYCSTSFQKADYYGKFPATFVKRVKRMFPTHRHKMLHLCCGTCHIEGAVNVDMQPLPEVDVVADVESLPFAAEAFDVCLIDPPYTEEDASRYGVKRLLSSRKTLEEIRRVLIPGGWLLWLDEKYPSYRRREWQLSGLIGIVTGFERRARILSMFRKPMAEQIGLVAG